MTRAAWPGALLLGSAYLRCLDYTVHTVLRSPYVKGRLPAPDYLFKSKNIRAVLLLVRLVFQDVIVVRWSRTPLGIYMYSRANLGVD